MLANVCFVRDNVFIIDDIEDVLAVVGMFCSANSSCEYCSVPYVFCMLYSECFSFG